MVGLHHQPTPPTQPLALTNNTENRPADALDAATETLKLETQRRQASYDQRFDAAMATINATLDRPLLSITRSLDSPKAILDAIQEHFDKPDDSLDHRDLDELITIRMHESESIIGYLDRINQIIARLESDQYKFKPSWRNHFIFFGLPSTYSEIVTIIRAKEGATFYMTTLVRLSCSTNLRCSFRAQEPAKVTLSTPRFPPKKPQQQRGGEQG